MDFGKVPGALAAFFECEGFRCAVGGAWGLDGDGLARASLGLGLATESAAQPPVVACLEYPGHETVRSLGSLGALPLDALRARSGPTGPSFALGPRA